MGAKNLLRRLAASRDLVFGYGLLAGLLIAVLVWGGPSRAHHTYVTKYDGAKVLTLRGVVTDLSFGNPHIYFYLKIKTKSGGTATWKIETESISKVRARGLTENQISPGKKVTVTGWPARSGGASLGLKSIRLQNGKLLSIRRTAR